MQRDVVMHTAVFAEGVLVQIWLNDLPLFKRPLPGPDSQAGGLNHLLVPGDNRVAFEIHRAPPPASEPTSPGAKSDAPAAPPEPAPKPLRLGKGQSILLALYTIDDPTAEHPTATVLHRWSFPEMWQVVPESRRTVPFYGQFRFTLDLPLYQRAYVTAPPADFGCSGTPELHHAVAEMHAAIGARDLDRFMDTIALEAQEYELAYQGHADGLVTGRRQLYDELFRHPIVNAPLDPATLHFGARAGGRVAHVTRHNGAPVLDAFLEDEPNRRIRGDLLLTQHQGKWRVM
jgi:hypothetical protein